MNCPHCHQPIEEENVMDTHFFADVKDGIQTGLKIVGKQNIGWKKGKNNNRLAGTIPIPVYMVSTGNKVTK